MNVRYKIEANSMKKLYQFSKRASNFDLIQKIWFFLYLLINPQTFAVQIKIRLLKTAFCFAISHLYLSKSSQKKIALQYLFVNPIFCIIIHQLIKIMNLFMDIEYLNHNNDFEQLQRLKQPQFDKNSQQVNDVNQITQTFQDLIQDPQYRPFTKQKEVLQNQPQKKTQDMFEPYYSLPINNYLPNNTRQLECDIQNKENENLEFKCKSNRSQINAQKITSYPTKNFLQAFKIIFYNQIERALGQKWKQIPHLKEIHDRHGINMAQFLQILKTPILKRHFSKYFRTQKIMRDLMKSRIKFPQKVIYFSHIHRFQQAFESGEFDHIN